MVEQHGKTLVPQIRFAGFTDPWEQRKLGELFEESDERASDREILSVSVANGIYHFVCQCSQRDIPSI